MKHASLELRTVYHGLTSCGDACNLNPNVTLLGRWTLKRNEGTRTPYGTLKPSESIWSLDSSILNAQFPLKRQTNLDRCQASTCAQRGSQTPMEVSNPVPVSPIYHGPPYSPATEGRMLSMIDICISCEMFGRYFIF